MALPPNAAGANTKPGEYGAVIGGNARNRQMHEQYGASDVAQGREQPRDEMLVNVAGAFSGYVLQQAQAIDDHICLAFSHQPRQRITIESRNGYLARGSGELHTLRAAEASSDRNDRNSAPHQIDGYCVPNQARGAENEDGHPLALTSSAWRSSAK
jgi:hypothetical protein